MTAPEQPWHVEPVRPPSEEARVAALERFAALATPAGALGRLQELGAWVAACQGRCPAEPLERVRAVVPAGDHGVVRSGVSAYPAAVTPAMVRALVRGVAGMSVLAAQHGVPVRVLDVSVDDDLADLPPEVGAHKLGRGCGAIDAEDAMSPAQARWALATGEQVAAEELAAGAQLVVVGDLGIGNTTPAAALVAHLLDLPAAAVTGPGAGLDDAGRARKSTVVQAAVDRAAGVTDPLERLAALGSPDLAVAVGIQLAAARAGVPVLLDGVVSVAEALVAESLAPGVAAWLAAGHRSPEPAQAHALSALGLQPVVDLGMRLGEGSGALAALPLLRSAVALLRDVALLEDLLPGGGPGSREQG